MADPATLLVALIGGGAAIVTHGAILFLPPFLAVVWFSRQRQHEALARERGANSRFEESEVKGTGGCLARCGQCMGLGGERWYGRFTGVSEWSRRTVGRITELEEKLAMDDKDDEDAGGQKSAGKLAANERGRMSWMRGNLGADGAKIRCYGAGSVRVL